MHFAFYLFRFKSSLKSFPIVLFAALIFSGYHANAQRRNNSGLQYGGGSNGGFSDSGYGISMNVDYDAPTSDLGNIYMRAPAYNLSLLYYRSGFTFNATLGYHVYKPKQSAFYYDDGSGGFGTVTYDNYPVYAVYAGGAYNLQLDELFRVYAGLNFGLYFTHFAYHAVDQFSESTADLNEQQVYIAPKAGFTYMINYHLGVGMEAKYNFFSPSGNSETNPLVGTVYRSYAFGVVLTYNL
jgi:hypothetical protein